MRSIAVMNQKGGVGKTTTAVNLSAALAEEGYRVCLIDLDPQAHASLHLGLSLEDGEPSVYDLLVREAQPEELRRQVADNLWVLPSHIDLAAAEMELAGEVGREMILRDRLAGEAIGSRQGTSGDYDGGPFDFTIIDCPPSLGVLTLNALVAVEEVFLPLQPHFLALHGLSKLLYTIEVVARRLNPRLRLSGVVLCMYESGTRLAAEVAGDVETFLARERSPHSPWATARAFQTRIRRNIRLAEAPSFGQSIFAYAPDCNGAEDYRLLCREVLERRSEAELTPELSRAAA